jgi:proteasome lid subunit RPN8/RPN11
MFLDIDSRWRPLEAAGRLVRWAEQPMEIARALYDEMVEHARAEAPNECCGMIAADTEGKLVKVHRMVNAAASPLRYEMDPAEQYEVEFKQIDEAGLEVGVVYHSHTRSAPYPSQTDINLAFHPQSVYVIVGLEKDKASGVYNVGDVRGFTIRDGAVDELAITVLD